MAVADKCALDDGSFFPFLRPGPGLETGTLSWGGRELWRKKSPICASRDRSPPSLPGRPAWQSTPVAITAMARCCWGRRVGVRRGELWEPGWARDPGPVGLGGPGLPATAFPWRHSPGLTAAGSGDGLRGLGAVALRQPYRPRKGVSRRAAPRDCPEPRGQAWRRKRKFARTAHLEPHFLNSRSSPTSYQGMDVRDDTMCRLFYSKLFAFESQLYTPNTQGFKVLGGDKQTWGLL